MESKANLGTYLRTAKTWQAYKNSPRRGSTVCFLCAAAREGKVLQEFNHFFVIVNDFPYDAVAEQHQMLVPKRHVAREADLNHQELRELQVMVEKFDQSEAYDCVIKNFFVGQSHPTHLHYHLVRWKRRA